MTDDQLSTLIKDAIGAAERAYVPYSHYHVGAALHTPDGAVYAGCNVENAAYPATICAERVALVKAVSEGERTFDTIVVATNNGGSPCGLCRQMLYEFAPKLRVVMVDFEGAVHWDGVLSDLLLNGFGPTDLET
ncbi:MAG: cytidine deaminase [Anaerolineae bacterium]|nr:cytidine deaminase [Anaerolineae bacterium]